MRGRGPSCMTPMWNSPEARAADALSVTGHRAPSSGGKPAFPLSDESSSRPGNRGGIGAGLPLRPPIERDKIRYRRPGDVVKRRFLLRRKRGALGVSMLGLSGDRPRKRRRQWQRQEVSWFGSGERLRRVRSDTINEQRRASKDKNSFPETGPTYSQPVQICACQHEADVMQADTSTSKEAQIGQLSGEIK
ncbi:UBAP1-MVB12-associated (UMA)-domain containing protein 1 isoform X13 [Chrysemys picta bellii]|uniref:UBAP1-MVB12-associated (UMA)-domain containing protein 1 isoform X13 n=1 Tax=Chrysemys picta bellii TaxID=8478 RepID=UPI0032B25AC5